MGWNRFSKETATFGQMIVLCGGGTYFTTTGFTRNAKGQKVYQGLAPHATP